jgi:hypothetical protein
MEAYRTFVRESLRGAAAGGAEGAGMNRDAVVYHTSCA